MRESWTDERLDDFAAHTDQRFDSLERRMETGFSEMNARFDGLQRTMTQGVIAGRIVHRRLRRLDCLDRDAAVGGATARRAGARSARAPGRAAAAGRR